MSKKLITILLLVINVISLKSEINEAVSTNLPTTIKPSCHPIKPSCHPIKPSCHPIKPNSHPIKPSSHPIGGGKPSKIKLEVWFTDDIKCEEPNSFSAIYMLPNDYPYTCEDTKHFIEKYNGVCLTESFSPRNTGVTFSTWDGHGTEPQHHGTSILFGKSGRFTFPECKQEDSFSSSSSNDGLPGWAIAIIVIVVIAVIVVISWFCCCRKQQNSIQPNISPKQNLYTANLHPINQSPAYMNGETPTEGEV